MKNAPVREGETLAGKYRVERVLGAGGMGVVVAAHHLQLDERVALKFLLPDAMDNPEVVARFAREARAAAKIKSEHVARVTDVGVLESGAPYLVMEFLNGTDLAALVAQSGPLPVAEVVEYVLQALEAVAEAHSLGIVHRDLKPGNLFLTQRHDGSPCVKVLDFGISKMRGAGVEDPAMTATNTAVGSPLYMSPEQMVSAKTVDQRSDVWSVGIILYELLTGRTPFTGATFAELVLNVAQQTPPSLRSQRGDLPVALEPIVLRCLEKDANRRFRHVGELASLLAPFGPPAGRTSVERISRMMGEGAPISVQAAAFGPGITTPIPAGTGPSATADAWGKTRIESAPKRSRLIGLGLAFVGVLVAVASFLGLRKPEPLPPSTAAPAEPTAAPPVSVATPIVVPVPVATATEATTPRSSNEITPVASSAKPAVHAPPRPAAALSTAKKSTPTPAPAPTPAPGKLDFGGRN